MLPALKILTSFRAKLILSLTITILIIFGFGFYTFIQSRQFGAILQDGSLTLEEVLILGSGANNLAQVSFIFLSLTVVFILGMIIILIINLTFSLRTILNGIKRIEGGDLSFRIPLNSHDEFGTIAQFLNKATSKVEITQKSIEQKVIERTQQLTAERNKLAMVLSGMTDAVLAVDLQSNIVIFNNAAEKLTGYNQKQVIGKPIGQIIKIYDQDNEIIPLNYCPVKADGYEGVVFSIQGVEIVGNQKRAFVNLISGTIRESANVNLGCIITLHDVTKEKQLDEMKIDFVSMAAHELRTPVTAIRGYLGLISKDTESTYSKRTQDYLKRAGISAGELTGHINNLLNVSQIERSAVTVQKEKLDWIDTVRSTIDNYQLTVRGKNISLSYAGPEEPVFVLADKISIREVLNNLISNAIHYTPANGSITVKVRVSLEGIITTVQDTGIGIPKDSLPRLFTKFYRVHGGLESGDGGTGLGLYISRSIVELHHGKIWVESKPNAGSTFSFSLPPFDEKIYTEELSKRPKILNQEWGELINGNHSQNSTSRR